MTKTPTTRLFLPGIFSAVFLYPFILFSQNKPPSVQDLADKYMALDTGRLDKTEKKTVVGFWNAMKNLRGYEQKQKELTGKAGFGFENNQTRTDKLFNLNAGIQVGRGIYPGEFTFTTKVDLTVRNGKFQENVSDIFLSYDYFPLQKNQMWLENFVFLNRFKDEFIGIEQRYEVGGGAIFEFWDKKHLTDDGVGKRKDMMPDTSGKTFLDAPWWSSMHGVCKKHDLKGPGSGDSLLLQAAHRRTDAALVTQYTRFRMGMLIGIYMESEQGTAADSVQLPAGRMFFTREPLNTIKTRWELRPTIVIRSHKRMEITLKPYFKFPMPWAWNETVRSNNPDVSDTRFDFHLDVRSEIRFTLTDDQQNKKITIGLEHRVLYDKSPPRVYLNDQLDADGRPVLLSARDTHQITRLKFEVEF